MSARVAPSVLEAARSQLHAKWRSTPGVVNMTVGLTAGGDPALFFCGPGRTPPAGLPGVMVVPDVDGSPYRVPIFWLVAPNGYAAPTPAVNPQAILVPKAELFNSRAGAALPLDPLNDEDIDRAYWSFFTPETRRPMRVFNPAFHVPQVPGAAAIPPAEIIDPQVALAIRLPQYNEPNFWAKPFEPIACPCFLFYATPFVAYTFTVPDTYLLIVDGISFSLPDCMANQEIIQIDIYRSGENVASFEEMMADNANADPGNRAAFSSHIRPTPLWLRFDRGDTLTVTITPKGLYPFTKTSVDSFCGNICVLLHGFLSSLIDNRDGGMRPIDVGAMREGEGDEMAATVTDEDMTLLVQWLTDVGAFAAERSRS